MNKFIKELQLHKKSKSKLMKDLTLKKKCLVKEENGF